MHCNMKVSPVGVKADETKTSAQVVQEESKERPFPKLGITLKGIQNFIEQVGGESRLQDLTTTQLSPIVQEVTKHQKCAYCDLPQLTATTVGLATVFVSHAWKYKFLSVVSALRNSYGEDSREIFWFDLFSNNQHGLDSGTPPRFTWWCNTFMNAIKDIGVVTMVIEPWSDPITLTRAWCLWEVYCAVATKSKFTVAMGEEEKKRFHLEIYHDASQFITMLSTVDVEKSEAFDAEDKRKIFEAVRGTVGFGRLNAKVKEVMRNWVIKELEEFTTGLEANLTVLENDIKSPESIRSAEEQVGSIREDKIMLAGLYSCLSDIAFSADLKDRKVKIWCEKAYSLSNTLLGPTNELTLQCLRKIANFNTLSRAEAVRRLKEAYGDDSVYTWDARFWNEYKQEIMEEFLVSMAKFEYTKENAEVASSVIYRAALTTIIHSQSKFVTPFRKNLNSALPKLRALLPPNTIILLKLEIYAIYHDFEVTEETIQPLKKYLNRLYEALGYYHKDVRTAYKNAAEIAFDHTRIYDLFSFGGTHIACSLFQWELIEAAQVGTYVELTPCNLSCYYSCLCCCGGFTKVTKAPFCQRWRPMAIDSLVSLVCIFPQCGITLCRFCCTSESTELI